MARGPWNLIYTKPHPAWGLNRNMELGGGGCDAAGERGRTAPSQIAET